MSDAIKIPHRSAVFEHALDKAAEAVGKTLEEAFLDPKLVAIADEQEALAVYGHDAKKDSRGNYIPQGIGARGRETSNHLAALRKSFGEQAYNRELRRIWKETPDHARRMGFPEPARID